MPKLIENGHLYLAVPPLYRLSHGGKVLYARDDRHKDELIRREFHGNARIELGRFKRLGEMMATQLKETTMDPRKRTLLRGGGRGRAQEDRPRSSGSWATSQRRGSRSSRSAQSSPTRRCWTSEAASLLNQSVSRP